MLFKIIYLNNLLIICILRKRFLIPEYEALYKLACKYFSISTVFNNGYQLLSNQCLKTSWKLN